MLGMEEKTILPVLDSILILGMIVLFLDANLQPMTER